MAIRYDQKTKDEVVAFITKYNDKNGRGGQSAAAAKWKLNPITVKAWMEKAGVASPGKTSKKKKKGAATRKPAAVKVKRSTKAASAKATGSVAGSLKRMVEIQEQIESLQAEYESLKTTL
ncbi:MAG: hypothetical protein P1U58_05855 [Verrucomicrobiales bacterium]|nr:hypothetical protein [Verrucomicrobiales bacterium]